MDLEKIMEKVMAGIAPVVKELVAGAIQLEAMRLNHSLQLEAIMEKRVIDSLRDATPRERADAGALAMNGLLEEEL
jgi:predicted nucleic acid-binding protein